jgi:bacteriorhodopsin
MGSPKLTGVPFDDACRYMDWPLTAPLLSIEILSLMNLSDAKFSRKARTLGLGPALMIVSVYYGELVVTFDLTPRWLRWLVSMAFSLYIVYELLVDVAAAASAEHDEEIRGKIIRPKS